MIAHSARGGMRTDHGAPEAIVVSKRDEARVVDMRMCENDMVYLMRIKAKVAVH